MAFSFYLFAFSVRLFTPPFDIVLGETDWCKAQLFVHIVAECVPEARRPGDTGTQVQKAAVGLLPSQLGIFPANKIV